MPTYRSEVYYSSYINEDQRLNLFLACEGKKMILADYMSNWMVTREGNNNWTNRIKKDPFEFECFRINESYELERIAYEAYGQRLCFDNGRARIFLGMLKSLIKHPKKAKIVKIKEYRKKIRLRTLVYVVLKKIYIIKE